MMLIQKIEQKAKTLLAQSEIKTSDLVSFLNSIEVTASDVQEYHQPDPKHPYGRRVLLNHPRLEVMLATWTRGYPCAPHDHGGSNSAIRVLQGQSHHRLYQIKEEKLIEVYSEKRAKGDVLICAPKQVHAYSGSIPDMIVYDDDKTLIVKGKCGAWIPEDEDDILLDKKGHFYRQDLESVEI